MFVEALTLDIDSVTRYRARAFRDPRHGSMVIKVCNSTSHIIIEGDNICLFSLRNTFRGFLLNSARVARHLGLPSQHEIEEMRVPDAAQFHPSVMLTDYVRPDGVLYQSAAEPECADPGGGRDDVQAVQTYECECERVLERVLPVSAARE